MKNKPKTPYQVAAPALNIVTEIMGAQLSSEARLICLRVFMNNLKVVEVDDMGKALRMRYHQSLVACRELRGAGVLKSLGSDLYEVVKPVGLKDIGFSAEVENGEEG